MIKATIRSIYTSVDGEVNGWKGAGEVSTFVRFAGCSLRCKYCDTMYAQNPNTGVRYGIGELFDKVMEQRPQKITITGGEPLEQPQALKAFVRMLSKLTPYLKVTLETNGIHPIGDFLVRDNVSVVMDYKPESICFLNVEQQETRRNNMERLTLKHVVKFIISCRKDYDKAVSIVKNESNFQVAFSPIYGVQSPSELVEWMIADKLPRAKLSLQLHKYVWPECVDSEVER
jgi:7-carboxy-7-deazaguanine synthase